MSSLVIVATITPLPEFRADVVAALEAAAAAVHANEPGCELYALHDPLDSSDPRVTLIEKWATEDAFAAHRQGAAAAALRTAVEGKLAGKWELRQLCPHPAGATRLGTL